MKCGYFERATKVLTSLVKCGPCGVHTCENTLTKISTKSALGILYNMSRTTEGDILEFQLSEEI